MGRSRFGAWLLFAAWLAGALGVGAWAVQVHPSPLRAALAVAVVIAGGLATRLAWRRSDAGILAWTGEGWHWTAVGGDPETGEPDAVLDLQHTLLLRWGSATRVRWFWVGRDSAPERWDDLRRAVYSRARPAAAPDAQPRGEGRT